MKKTTGKSHAHGKGYCIVKRGKHCEKYDEKKVYGSVYAACYVVLRREKECEKTAKRIAQNVTVSVRKKKSINSSAIARMAAKELKKHNVHAAFMYETHRDIS